MKVKLSYIIEAIDIHSEESRSLINKKTGKLIYIQDEYLSAVEEEEDLSGFVGWELEEIKKAKGI